MISGKLIQCQVVNFLVDIYNYMNNGLGLMESIAKIINEAPKIHTTIFLLIFLFPFNIMPNSPNTNNNPPHNTNINLMASIKL